MSMKIHGVPPQLRRASLEPADQAKPEAPRALSTQGLDRFEGLSGAERAEMQRFMNLKARAEAAPHGGGRSVRSVGAATAALLSDRQGGVTAERAQDAFGRYDLSDYQNAQRNSLDDRNPEVMNALPESVRDSFAHYYDHAEANDWATVYLSRHELDGESLYMVATRTDGSDNYMELFGADGRPLASGEAMENEPRRWDAEFGASRARVVYD